MSRKGRASLAKGKQHAKAERRRLAAQQAREQALTARLDAETARVAALETDTQQLHATLGRIAALQAQVQAIDVEELADLAEEIATLLGEYLTLREQMSGLQRKHSKAWLDAAIGRALEQDRSGIELLEDEVRAMYPDQEVIVTGGVSRPERFTAEQIRRLQRARGLRDPRGRQRRPGTGPITWRV
jgi:chromosome segregation ATPase